MSAGIAIATSAAILMPAVAATSAANAVTTTPTTTTTTTVTTTPVPESTVTPPAVKPLVKKPTVHKPTKWQIKVAKQRARHLRAARMRARLVAFAKTRLHHRGQYVAAASSNWRFDCSGFTKLIYKRVAHINLPHYSVAQWHSRRGHKVSKRALLPGDILVWGAGGSQHASMYIGHGKMIGANNPRSDVAINSINDSYWRPRYAGAVRFIWG